MKRRFTILTAAIALLALIVLPGKAWADSETITFADLGLENGVQYLDPFGTNISVTFAGGQNDGKYYTTGSGIRTYGNGTITITANGNTVTEISTIFSADSYAPTSNDVWSCDGTTTSSTSGINASWLGSATEIVMTRPSGSGHWRLQAITVTYTTGVSDTPSISADNTGIAFDATSGGIEYTINNPVEGGVLTANTEAEWLTIGTVGEETVAFTCTANEGAIRTATVTLTYTYGDNETVSKDVTVTQAAAPVIYSTIPALFAAATSTETNVLVTFNDWVVSGVSTNGKNVFVTDNNGNGFVIYDNNGGLDNTYTAGNILAGTAVPCSLKKYTGFAELVNVDANDLTITTGGTVTVANVDMADLAGVNTGALLHYDNLTCSVSNNKYYLSDGTTTLQVYNALYAFDALEDGKIYNITGIYQQFNNTKEILPRSADDIEEVVSAEPSITVNPDEVNVDAEEHDGTLDLTYENLTITDMSDFDIQYYDAEGEETTEPDWIEVLVAEQDPEIGEGYVVSYFMVENEGESRTTYFKVYAMNDEAELIYSNLVTVNQAAPVVPPTPGNWVLTSLADLTPSDVFVIVGTRTDATYGGNYAMPNDNGTSAPSAVSITVVDGTLSEEPATNLQWNLGNITDGYIFYPNGTTESWLYCTNTNNGVRVGTNTNNAFVIDQESGYLMNVVTSRYLGIYNAQDWRCYTNTTGNIANQTFAFYKKVTEPVTETYTFDITGYEAGSNGGYYLIASPVTVDPADVEGMTEGTTFDLYYFDQTEDLEWRNYKTQTFNLVPGKGYLYAKQATTEGEIFHFELTGTPYDGDGTIELNYTEGGDFPGWNLIGNPYNEEVGLNLPFYRMNTEGTEVEPVSQGTVNPMEGVFVIAQTDPETGDIINAQFTAGMGSNSGEDKLVLNVSRNRGNVVDRAIVRFGQGGVLPKFQLNENSTKLCIVEGENEYAVVRSASEGEMPVNFKASENGNYTLSVNAENVEMEYLHLIDNMTGTDVDLLATPSYSFEARTNDYESRFRLVFSGNTNVGSSTGTETFAFFNGNSWVINNEGEATLQVIDMTGRVLSNEQINGSYNNSLNLSAGVYVLRLSKGNTVKTQKVVVD